MAAASEIAPVPAPRASSWRLKLGGMALIGSAALGWSALKDWHDHHAFLINASESLPNWALLVETGRFPARGDYVVFAPAMIHWSSSISGPTPSPSPRSPMACQAMSSPAWAMPCR
jgi:conjugal transfer pilin signal peptidase TrbI